MKFFKISHSRQARTALSLLVAGLWSGSLLAELPPAPQLDGWAVKSDKAAPGKAVAKVEVINGAPRVGDPASQSLAAGGFGTTLAQGQLLTTGEQDRALVRLENGDLLHVGPNSLLAVEKKDEAFSVQIWRGTVMAYALPEMKGRKSPLTLHLAQGQLAMRSSKVAVVSEGDNSRILVLGTEATWQPAQGEALVVEAGQGVKLADKTLFNVEPAMEETMVSTTNPAIQVAKQAVEAFQAQDYDNAKTHFNHLQTSYPYHGEAAYFLGLIGIEQGKKQETVKQWKLYNTLEPEEAAKREIPQKLTLLLTEQMKDEINKAMAIEKKFASGKPEPNSVAVSPLVNKGDEKYKILSKGLTAMIITDLAKVPGLKVLEREKMQKIMDELSLMKSGLVDEESTVRAGRIMRAEKVIVGDYAVK